jgi:hypothetical protein
MTTGDDEQSGARIALPHQHRARGERALLTTAGYVMQFFLVKADKQIDMSKGIFVHNRYTP